mgnify:CR=1 FL=1
MSQLSNFIETRRLKALAVALSSVLALSSCTSISVMTADLMASMGSTDEVEVDIPPAPQPVYEEGDTFVFEVGGVQVVETVTEVNKDVVHWGDDNGNTWATLHDPILQPISEIEISRRYSQAALSVFPLQKGRTITFTVFEMPRDGAERRRVETCVVEGAFRITVKAGEFDTHKVRCKRRNFYETLYYAPRVGHVVKFVREGSLTGGVSELVTHRKKSDPVKPEEKAAAEPEAAPAPPPEMKMQTPEMKDAVRADPSTKTSPTISKMYPTPTPTISKMYIDSEISQVSNKVERISGDVDRVAEKVEDLSQRVDDLADRIDGLPTASAGAMARKPELQAAVPFPSSPNNPMLAKTPAPAEKKKPADKPKPMAAKASGPYWGIQVGAYKDIPGAKQAWAEILANPAAIELNDATVNYVEQTRKNGTKMYRIIVNQYANKKTAQAACKLFKGYGVDCWATLIK